jgi:4'-phosphopantetheinyl transferase
MHPFDVCVGPGAVSVSLTSWGDSPAEVSIPGAAVHVWCASLDPPEHIIQGYESLLSAEEIRRAGRFHFELHRRSFCISRGVLRALLSRYLRVDPRTIEFSQTSQGKPYVAGPSMNERLCFNVSHSGDLALYAVAAGREVGVDVEAIHPIREAEAIAHEMFSTDERAALDAFRPEEREAAFFTLWTRREAFLKALGTGLSFPLRRTSAADPGGQLNPTPTSDSWTCVDLHPAPGYAAALVVAGRGWTLYTWRWEHASLEAALEHGHRTTVIWASGRQLPKGMVTGSGS